MGRYLAFLRAVNVGGRTVPMARLRDVVAGLGHDAVETYIASGNVIFESTSRSPRTLETALSAALQDELGIEVATFVRTDRQVAAIADEDPFGPPPRGAAKVTAHVGFLARKPAAAVVKRVEALATEVDELRVVGTELHWRIAGGFSDSKVTGAALEKALGMPMTVRNRNTVEKLAAKYPPGS